MSLRDTALVLTAVFLLMFGLFKVTNIQVAWGEQIMGFSALVAGVVLLISLFRGRS